MPIKAPAIVFKQGDKKLYLTALPAGEIVDKTYVDRYKPGTMEGYQRNPIESHIGKIAKYVKRKDALMPLPGVLSIRTTGKVDFRPIPNDQSGYPKSGVLTIDDGTTVYVVDMQHRREGFERAFHQKRSLRNYTLPVVIVENLSLQDEALQFYIMNMKQKRLDSDLALEVVLEHFDTRQVREITSLEDWEIKAAQITIALNKDATPGNPWYQKIKRPNTPPGSGTLVSEKTFVRSLGPLLVDSRIGKCSARKIAKYTRDFWFSLSRVFPNEFNNPKSFRLQKYTTSVVALHVIMPFLLEEAKGNRRLDDTDKLRDFLVGRLDPLKTLGGDFWQRTNDTGVIGYGTGYGAEGRFAGDLAATLSVQL